MRTNKDFKLIQFCCQMTMLVPDDRKTMPNKHNQIIEHIIQLNEHCTHKINTDEYTEFETIYLDFRNWLLDRYFDANYDFEVHFEEIYSKSNRKLWKKQGEYTKNCIFLCHALEEYFERCGMDRREFYQEDQHSFSVLNQLGFVAYKMRLCAIEYVRQYIPWFGNYRITSCQEAIRTGKVFWS